LLRFKEVIDIEALLLLDVTFGLSVIDVVCHLGLELLLIVLLHLPSGLFLEDLRVPVLVGLLEIAIELIPLLVKESLGPLLFDLSLNLGLLSRIILLLAVILELLLLLGVNNRLLLAW
jgi:hypothetical protein